METNIKQYEAIDLSVVEGSREVVAIISTDAIDRDGEIVVPKGMVKKNFQGNPIVLLQHKTDKLPVGVARWVKVSGNQVIAKFYVSDKTDDGKDVFGLLQDKVLNAFSIQFRPIEQGPPTAKEIKDNPTWAGARNIIRKWELLEFSIVSIPCNPEALVLSVAKGFCSAGNVAKCCGYDLPDEDCFVWDNEQTHEKEPTKTENTKEQIQAVAIPMPKYIKRINENEEMEQ